MPAHDRPHIPLSHLTAAPDPKRKFRLLEQVRRGLRVRHYSRRTEIAYCAWVRRFVVFHGRRHPSLMGETEIAGFLNQLATDGRVSASTQNQHSTRCSFCTGTYWVETLAWCRDLRLQNVGGGRRSCCLLV